MGYFPAENPKNCVFRRAISDRPYVPIRQLRLFWSGGYRWCVGGVITPPYKGFSNSIRRADHSDQSSGPNGLIRPPGHQNELAPGPARYAERKLATSRVSPMALFAHQGIRTNWLWPRPVHKKFSILFVQSVIYYHQRAPGWADPGNKKKYTQA